MKKLLVALFLTFCGRLLAVVPAPYTEPVSFSFLIAGYGSGTMTVYAEPGDSVVQTTANTWTESASKAAWLRPGKAYSVNFQSTDIDHYSLSFIAPAGYALYIDGAQADMHNESPGGGVVNVNHTIELRPITGRAAAGVFSGINLGRSVTWDVGLGGLRDGRSAGRISFREKDLAYSSYPATRDRLYYTPPPSIGQITTVYDGPSSQTPRQIMVPQTLVDLVDDGGGGYWINFYTPAQGTWTGSGYSISGSPWKTIRVESPGAHQMKVTETEGSVSKVSLLTLPSYTAVQATGGTVTANGPKTVHTFTSGGTFTVTSGALTSVEALVVAGGGGGGGGLLGVMNAGGGGGGGVLYNASLGVSTGGYSVTVGSGGASGTNGGNSVFSSMTAIGGGHGAHNGWAASGASGGSGGGEGTAQGGSAGAGTSGQGYAGGAGSSAPNYEGGAGGGAGWGAFAYWAGWGVAYSISGTSTYYGAGGGAGSNASTGSVGGGHGGGNGGGSTVALGTDGTPNTGGGGGGSAQWTSTGGAGGSGVVIISYSDSTSGTVASGNYVWRLQEGDASTCLRTTTHTSTTYSGYREEVVEVRTGGSYGSTSGTIVSKTKYRYENVGGWGEEVTAITTDPDSAALTTSYTYHTTSAEFGNYRRVQTITQPDGNWASYAYHGDWNQRGQLAVQSGPWLDSPGTATAAAYTVGRSSTHTYAPDFSGRYRLPYRSYAYVSGAATGQTNFAPWTNQVLNGQPFMSDTVDAYSDSSTYVRSANQVIQGDGNPDYVGKPIQFQRPDGTLASMAYYYGSYNYSTKAFTYPGDLSHWREMVWHGTTAYVAGGYFNGYDGLGVPALYLVPNQSTLSVTIRNGAGDVVRTETHICSSGTTFSLATWEDFTYDAQGRLASRVASNGATTTNTYTNGRLTSTVDPTGTENQFTYDALGRVATSVKMGASASGSYAAQGDITNTHAYDGANRVTQTVSSGSSLSLTASRAYDLAGRPTSATAPGSYTTGFAYSSGGRVVTTTLPGGATKITEVHLDGQLKQVTGTGVVQETHTHTIAGGGVYFRQSLFGGNSSAWTNSYFDWLGRKVEEWIPGWNGYAVGRHWHYNSSGQLWKHVQPGLADTLYVYDATTGKLAREGLDLNANGALDLSSNDRITDHVDEFYPNGGVDWWRKRQNQVYATGSSGTATSLGVTYERISGFSSGQLSQTNSYDIYGNLSYVTTYVDRSNKLVTTTRYAPDSTATAVTIAYNGLLMSSRDTANLTTTFGHDALGRPVTSTDPRTGTTTTAYISGTSQVSTVTDPASIVQATYTYDAAGRVSSVKDALNKYAYTSYTDRNEVYRQWGDTTYPVEYAYNGSGQRTSLKTYRGGSGWTGSTWPGSPGTADTTTWTWHAATNLLSSKTDAASKSVSYTYTQARQIDVRTWARGVTTTYGYSSTTGELTGVDYSDSTTDLAYTYNRLGNTATVTDFTGTRTFNYNLGGTLELQSEDLSSFFGANRRITYPRATSGVVGRPTGLQLGTTGSPTADQSNTYGYDTYGRFNSYGGGGHTFSYGYAANSNLVGTVANSAASYTDTRGYDANHNWTDSRATTISSTTIARFDYAQDNLGRIDSVTKSGSVFSRYGNGTQGLLTGYGYNDRSEVTGEVTYLASSGFTVLTGRSDAYAFDNIGNRSSSSGTTHNGNSADYTTNALNQYTQRTVPGVFDVAGAAGSGTTVTVNSSSSGVTRHGEYFFKGHGMANNPNPVFSTLAVSDGTTTANIPAFTAGTPESFAYDDDGNLLSDGRWTYAYDAENRPIWVTTASAAATAGHPKLGFDFIYDYLGRRVRKQDFYWNGTWWSQGDDHRYLYNGWSQIAEYWGAYTGSFVSTNVRHAYWGLDLSGSLQGAGGVGGLVMIQEAGNSYLPAYDATGNLHALYNATNTSIEAAYEYDAFGNTLRESGPYAASNPFRFSTKYTDIETGLVYYGLRYYSPTLGRFINKDPIEEQGGLNLYGFVGNNGVNRWDYLGMNAMEMDGSGGFDPSEKVARGPMTMSAKVSVMAHTAGWGVFAETRSEKAEREERETMERHGITATKDNDGNVIYLIPSELAGRLEGGLAKDSSYTVTTTEEVYGEMRNGEVSNIWLPKFSVTPERSNGTTQNWRDAHPTAAVNADFDVANRNVSNPQDLFMAVGNRFSEIGIGGAPAAMARGAVVLTAMAAGGSAIYAGGTVAAPVVIEGVKGFAALSPAGKAFLIGGAFRLYFGGGGEHTATGQAARRVLANTVAKETASAVANDIARGAGRGGASPGP